MSDAALRFANFVMRDGQPGLRRALLFVSGVGMPVVLTMALGQPALALPISMVGLLLSFADHDGSYSKRVETLLAVAGGLIAGAALGFFSKDHPPLHWTLLVIASIACGYGALLDRVTMIVLRDGLIGFSIGTIVSPPTELQIKLLITVLAIVLVTRSIDHLAFGPLPPLEGGQKLQRPTTDFERTRFISAYATAAVFALGIGEILDPPHAPWIAVSTLVVLQPDAGASYRRILDRVAGAFIGVGAAWITLVVIHSPFVLTGTILAIAANLPHHLKRRYWMHTALIAWIVLLIYALGGNAHLSAAAVLVERLTDMLIGCSIAVVATYAAFGRLRDPPCSPP